MTPLSEWLASPDVALMVLLVGVLLIYLECNRPGRVIPGCVGGLFVLIAAHSLAIRQVRPGAVGLALFGTGLVVLAASLRVRRDSQMTLLGVGIVGITSGLRWLLQPLQAEHVHPLTAWICALIFGGVTYRLTAIAFKARRNKRQTGSFGDRWEPSGRATR